MGAGCGVPGYLHGSLSNPKYNMGPRHIGSQVQHAVCFGIIGCLSGHVDLIVDQGGKICVAALSRPH